MNPPPSSPGPDVSPAGASLPSPDATFDFRIVIGPLAEDGSVTLSLKLTNTTTIADLRRLIEPLAPSAIRETVPGRRHETEPKPVHPLPAGMTAWVSANDVARALSCSHAKAHEYLRAAAGRSIGTGHLLRVPVDIWESWARGNLVDGRRKVRTWTPSSSTTDGQLAGTSSKPKRRKLGPYSEVTSKLPLIPTLKYTKI